MATAAAQPTDAATWAVSASLRRPGVSVIALVRQLLLEGAASGEIRDEVAPDELAHCCLHALTAASALPSKPAVRRLVTVTLAGLRPQR